MQNLDHGILLNDLGMEILYSGMDVKKKKLVKKVLEIWLQQ